MTWPRGPNVNAERALTSFLNVRVLSLSLARPFLHNSREPSETLISQTFRGHPATPKPPPPLLPPGAMAAADSSAAPSHQLSQRETDIQMMLAADVHLGTKNCDFQMERYVFKRRTDGHCSILNFSFLFILCWNSDFLCIVLSVFYNGMICVCNVTKFISDTPSLFSNLIRVNIYNYSNVEFWVP